MKTVSVNPRAESWLILSVVVAGCLALSLCVQPLVDDWIYMVSSGRTFEEFWSCSGGPSQGFADVLRNCWYHYLHTNGRLTDKLLIIASTSLPGWLARTFCLLMFGIGLGALLRLAGGRREMSAPGFVALLLLLCLLLPAWDHYMISLACEFNYMVPMGLCFPVMLWMLEAPRLRWWMCAVAFLGGWTHESFSLSVCAAMGLLLLIDRFRWSRTQWSVAGAYLAGTLALMLAPSTFARMDYAPVQCVYAARVLHTLLTLPSLELLVAVMLAAAAWAFIIGKRTVWLPWRPLLFMLAAAATGIAIGVLTVERGRAYWFSDLVTAACTMFVLRSVWPSLMKPHRALGLLLGTAMAAWLVWLSATQYGYSKEAEKLSAALCESPGTGIIWADVSTPLDAFPWQLGTTHPPVNESVYNLLAMNYHYARRPLKGQTAVLPTRFRDVHYTQWDSLPGASGVYGAFPVYYVPELSGRNVKGTWTRTFVFSMTRSPLSPQNLLAKLRGVKSLRLAYTPFIIRIPASRLRPGELASFTDPRTGVAPDTLGFIYVEQLPRPARHCPPDSVL